MDISSLNSLGSNLSASDSTSALAKMQTANETAKLESFQDQLLMAEDDEELKEACEQFEEYFINLMFKEMDKTIMKDDSEDSIFKESQAESYFKDFLYEEYSKSMTQAGGIGLAQQMYDQMQQQNQGVVSTQQLLDEEE